MNVPLDKELLCAFERALAEGHFHMAYQPKVSLCDGSVERVEALIRWDHPELGKVEPARFIPLAEKHGWIDELSIWGLSTILQQWTKWHDQGVDMQIAFNISALSLQHLDFPDLVGRLCRSLDVPTDRLMLELTEGATQPLIKLMDTLTRFRIKGIGLAIDDFGTGYSSLLQLRRLPFTEVKIDRAFVADIEQSGDSQLIIKSIIDLAHAMGLSATAEGLENVAQLERLRDLGCDLAQGYLFAPPMAAQELGPWIEQFSGRWSSLSGDAQASVSADIESNALG